MKKNNLILLICLTLMGCANTALDALKGKHEDDIRAQKGEPLAMVYENGHAMWTYRDNACREFIFFDAQGEVADLYQQGTCLSAE